MNKGKKKMLCDLLENELVDTLQNERRELLALDQECHEVFSVEDSERGKTNWTKMHIDTNP